MIGRPDKEMRRFPRLRFNQPVECQQVDTGPVSGTLSSDVSQGGLAIQSSEFVPLHTGLILKIQLAQDKFLNCHGRVVRVEQVPFSERFKLGIQLDEPASEMSFAG